MFNFNRPVFRTGTQPVMTRDMLRASGTVDLASIATTARGSSTLACPGAAVGDDVDVYPTTPTAGLVYNAKVTATDVVTIYAQNITAGAIDETSQTYRVIVWKARSI
jgi:hypothetical protein